jgi:cytochrome c2
MYGIAACTIVASTVITGASLAAVNAAAQGDPLRGERLYQACAACHSLDENAASSAAARAVSRTTPILRRSRLPA